MSDAPPPASAQAQPATQQQPANDSASATAEKKPVAGNSTLNPDGPKGDGGTVKLTGKLEGKCLHCGVAMGNFLGTMTPDGPLHNDCVPEYRRLHVERCVHCDCVLREARSIVGGKKLHPECVADFKAKKPFEPPRKEGILTKFAVGRSFFSGKNWKERYFVLSKQTGLAYYTDKAEYQSGKAPKNSVIITSQTRMITKPTRLIHPDASNPSLEIIVVFFEGGQERRLLVRCKSWEEQQEWIRAFESYIKIIDDPKDMRESDK